MKKCQKYGVDYGLMTRLKYHDLLALIVEYDIETLKNYLHQKEQRRQSSKGIHKQQASNQDIINMHKK